MTEAEIDRNAKIIWDYMLMHDEIKPADAIWVLCSLSRRPAYRAAELYKQGYAPLVVLSGGYGEFTRDVLDKPEADLYADILRKEEVPESAIIIENQSSNTGENVQFTYQLLQQRGLQFHSIIMVQKPYMERRTYATVKRQWPGPESTEFRVTSPQISYDDYFDDHEIKEHLLNVMVGDLQRIREYPKAGYQIEQPIPEKVWQAYDTLVAAGYDTHLIKH